jgi:hypothetical protein
MLCQQTRTKGSTGNKGPLDRLMCLFSKVWLRILCQEDIKHFSLMSVTLPALPNFYHLPLSHMTTVISLQSGTTSVRSSEALDVWYEFIVPPMTDGSIPPALLSGNVCQPIFYLYRNTDSFRSIKQSPPWTRYCWPMSKLPDLMTYSGAILLDYSYTVADRNFTFIAAHHLIRRNRLNLLYQSSELSRKSEDVGGLQTIPRGHVLAACGTSEFPQ